MTEKYAVLVVDDEEPILNLLRKELTSPERLIQTAADAKQARRKLKDNRFDIVVLDIRLPDADGLALYSEFKAKSPDMEVVLITGHGNIDDAVEAMRLGAYDYITKPFKLDRLELVLDRAYQRVCLQRENRSLRHSQENSRDTHLLVGKSQAIKDIEYLISKVAPTEVPVLITGESGSGKDVVARKIHAQSGRADKPLIIKNCALLQRELVRSELFGHRRGSFTGATEAKEGLMTLAHRGTLFLDEIGDLPTDVQSSLLRVLESKAYRPVGDNEERMADIRFLFATNRDLTKDLKDGKFNEALYHRINVFNIRISPLSERKEDIPLLVEHFLALLHTGHNRPVIAEKTMQCLMRYDWPGNIRELRNVLERSLILSENGVITNEALPRELVMDLSGSEDGDPSTSLDEMERKHILKILELCGGNRQKAAQALGIGRKTLYRKIQKYDILS